MGIEHSKHIFRVFLLLAVILVIVFVGRIILIKVTLPTFGEYGHYRGNSPAENADREVRHGKAFEEQNDFCKGCHAKGDDGSETALHDEVWETHSEGPHQSVPCEDCHDALATHVKDGVKIAEMPKIKSVLGLCGRCHQELEARPADFPQVNIETHPEEMGAEPSDEVCFDCHSPHDPTP